MTSPETLLTNFYKSKPDYKRYSCVLLRVYLKICTGIPHNHNELALHLKVNTQHLKNLTKWVTNYCNSNELGVSLEHDMYPFESLSELVNVSSITLRKQFLEDMYNQSIKD